MVGSLSYTLEDKQFRECELVGPANLVLNDCLLYDITLSNCDIIVQTKPLTFHNIVLMKKCNITGGKLYNCTLIINERAWEEIFSKMPAKFNLLGYLR